MRMLNERDVLRNDEVNESSDCWAWRCFQYIGYVVEKLEIIKKLLFTKFLTYFFKYRDRQSSW